MKLAVPLLLLFLLGTFASVAPFEFLSKLDFRNLDHMVLTTISLDLKHISDQDYEVLEELYGTFSVTSELKGLVITDFDDERIITDDGQSNPYIKDPNITYIFKVDLDSNTPQTNRFVRIAYQPYYFLWVIDNDLEELYEIQSYNSDPPRQVRLAKWNKTSKDDIQYENQNIYERRRDFFKSPVTTTHDVEPYFQLSLEGKYNGFDGKVLQTLEDEFNLTIKWVPLNGYGVQLPNGSWNGVVGSLIEHELDFGPLMFIHSDARMKVVDPGFRFMQATFSIIYKRSSKSMYNFFALSGVFHWSFWIIFLSFCLLNWLILTLVLRYETSKDWIFLISLVAVLKAMIGKSTDAHQPSIRHSVHGLLFCISLFTGLIFWIYTGSLTSFLIVNEQKPPLSMLDDLNTKSNFKLYVVKGGSDNDLMLRWARKSSKNEAAFQRHVETFTYSQLFQTLQSISMNENSALLTDTALIWSWLSSEWPHDDFCGFAISHLMDIPSTPVGWLFPKDSILQPLINEFLTKLAKNGIFHRLIKKYLESGSEDMTCENQPFSSIQFDLVEVVFWILLLGVIVSIFTFFVEHIFNFIPFGHPETKKEQLPKYNEISLRRTVQ